MSELYLKYVESSLPLSFHILLCLFAYIFWVSLASVVIPIFLVYQVIRLIEVAWISVKGIGTTFALNDLPFALDSEANPNYINALITMELPINLKDFRKRFAEKIVDNDRYRRMRQSIRTLFNICVWRDVEQFDINKQIVLFNGKQPSNQSELEKCFSRLCSRSLPSSISPWQFTLIPLQLNGKHQSAIHVKMHHSLGDGFSLVGLLTQIVDAKPKLLTQKKNQGYMKDPIRRYLRGLCTGPLSLLVIALSKHVKNPFRSGKTPSKKRVAWTKPIELGIVKKIKSKTGTTVNDVLISCLAGAIRTYLKEDGISNPKDHPISMTFNNRSFSHRVLETVPLGNNSGASFLSLPVSVEDPVRRLKLSKNRIDKMKQSCDPHLFSFVFQYIIALLPLSFAKITTGHIHRHCSLIFSNVPGPLEPISISGNRIDSVMVIPPLVGNVGLVMAIFSYAGKIRFTVLSDGVALRSPSRLTEAFEREVTLLQHKLLLK